MGHPNHTSKAKKNSQADFAKKATDWLAEQFTVTKAIKTKREKGDIAGKKAEGK